MKKGTLKVYPAHPTASTAHIRRHWTRTFSRSSRLTSARRKDRSRKDQSGRIKWPCLHTLPHYAMAPVSSRTNSGRSRSSTRVRCRSCPVCRSNELFSVPARSVNHNGTSTRTRSPTSPAEPCSSRCWAMLTSSPVSWCERSRCITSNPARFITSRCRRGGGGDHRRPAYFSAAALFVAE